MDQRQPRDFVFGWLVPALLLRLEQIGWIAVERLPSLAAKKILISRPYAICYCSPRQPQAQPKRRGGPQSRAARFSTKKHRHEQARMFSARLILCRAGAHTRTSGPARAFVCRRRTAELRENRQLHEQLWIVLVHPVRPARMRSALGHQHSFLFTCLWFKWNEISCDNRVALSQRL